VLALAGIMTLRLLGIDVTPVLAGAGVAGPRLCQLAEEAVC
jgi:small-conductance mechanosensitive channel